MRCCFGTGRALENHSFVEFHGVRVGSDASPDRCFLALLRRDLVECLVAHITFPL